MSAISEQYEIFMFDLDGVVIIGDTLQPNASEVIQRLKNENKVVRIVTNNSRSRREALAADLRELGVPIETEEVFSAAWATANYLTDQEYDTVYVIGADGFCSMIVDGGMAVADEDTPAEQIDAVAIGHDSSVTYDDLKDATQLIHYHDADFIAAHGDGSYPSGDGLAPGTGAIVRAIEAATDRSATTIGKPKSTIFETALVGQSPDDAVMIGDNPSADVVGAHNAGIDSILLATDEYSAGSTDPDAIITDLSELFAVDK